MKVSIIISVFNSHKVVRKYFLYLSKMPLPDDCEFILMDDGSDYPIEMPPGMPPNMRIIPTNDKRLWTQGLARMKGASEAKGEYLFFTDIDHIISKEALDAARNFKEDRMLFPRYFGVLSNLGWLINDDKSMLDFGLSKSRYRRRKLSGGVHMNTFVIRKSVWFEIGQYSLGRASSQVHTMGEDREFNKRWNRAVRAGKYISHSIGPKIYVYPVGRFRDDGNVNPYGLFHSQPRNDLGQS